MLSNFIKEKAREISYALIRVSFYVKEAEFSSRLKNSAFQLLDNSARASINNSLENLNKVLEDISALDNLVRLGHSIYEIEPINATILVRELDKLNSAIQEFGNLKVQREPLPDLESLFTLSIANKKPDPSDLTVNKNQNNISIENNNIRIRDINKIDLENNKAMADNSNNNNINSAIRQSAIIDKIKSGNTINGPQQEGYKLKDLIAEFPEVSERTLRYDLQRLCERGVIERVGNGGPASHYRLVEVSRPMAVSGAKLEVR